MSTQLQAVSLRMQTLRSTQQMSEAMRGASKALGSMNRSMNIMAVQRILQDFERETSTMDMKDEMMNDTMEDALGGEEDAMGEGIGETEESDTILRQVLDEIGVSVNQQVCARTDASSAMYQAPRPPRHRRPSRNGSPSGRASAHLRRRTITMSRRCRRV